MKYFRFRKPIYRASIFTLAVIFALGIQTLSYGQIPIPGLSKKDKDKDKKEKISEKQIAVDDAVNVAKLVVYGNKKYQSDSDFKLQVEKFYNELKRAHQQKAFKINTQPPLRVMGDLEGEGGNNSARYMGAISASNEVSDALYDNPMLQDYINRVGQSLVPANSNKVYAFRILQDPLPRAESLSTGTIYISTGMLGTLDNEAQLAYVLGHEIAHIEKDHWFNKVMLPLALSEYNDERLLEAAVINRKKEQRRNLFALGGSVVGTGIAGAAGSRLADGFNLGQDITYTVASLLDPNAKAATLGITHWGRTEEDEADKTSFDLCLAKNYDVNEVPKLYAVVKSLVLVEPRAGLGFMAEPSRVGERISETENQLTVNKSKIEQLSKDRKLVISQPDFEVLMAEVKRDNGVIAFYYDMFNMTKKNLESSLRIRSDDAKAHYYFARVLKLTSKNPIEKERALSSFATAYRLDKDRGSLPGIRLQMALGLMDLRNPGKNSEITNYLKEYVRLYKINNSGAVPPNMDIIYDYLTQSGDKAWFSAPTSNISTQDLAPVNVQATNTQTTTTTTNSTNPTVSKPETSPSRSKR